jgi:hypothetical protein
MRDEFFHWEIRHRFLWYSASANDEPDQACSKRLNVWAGVGVLLELYPVRQELPDDNGAQRLAGGVKHGNAFSDLRRFEITFSVADRAEEINVI